MIRIRFFWARRINSDWVSGGTVHTSMSRWTLVQLRHNRRFQIFRLAIPRKSSHFLDLTDHESFFWWHAVQRSRFLDSIFRENDVRLSLVPCQPGFHGTISDPDCLLARMCTCTSLFIRLATLGSCTFSQKHARTQLSRRFSLEISSGTMLRVQSPTLSRCCRLVVFLAEDPQGQPHRTTDTIYYSIRIFNLALTLMAGSRAISHQCSLDSSASHSLQQLYQQGLLV